MFKPTLKKLRSFVATCMLLMAPVGFSDATRSNNEIAPSYVDVRTNVLANSCNDGREQEDELPSLYWRETFNALAKQRDDQGLPVNLDLQIALTKVEEAYQDEFDRLLDWQDEQIQLLNHDDAAMAKIRTLVEKELSLHKQLKQTKIKQVKQLYS